MWQTRCKHDGDDHPCAASVLGLFAFELGLFCLCVRYVGGERGFIDREIGAQNGTKSKECCAFVEARVASGKKWISARWSGPGRIPPPPKTQTSRFQPGTNAPNHFWWPTTYLLLRWLPGDPPPMCVCTWVWVWYVVCTLVCIGWGGSQRKYIEREEQ